MTVLSSFPPLSFLFLLMRIAMVLETKLPLLPNHSTKESIPQTPEPSEFYPLMPRTPTHAHGCSAAHPLINPTHFLQSFGNRSVTSKGKERDGKEVIRRS